MVEQIGKIARGEAIDRAEWEEYMKLYLNLVRSGMIAKAAKAVMDLYME